MTAQILRLCLLVSLVSVAGCDNDDSSRSRPDTGPEPQPEPVVLMQETIDLPSQAQPAHTPGTPGVSVENSKLLTQFDGAEVNLNKARYTRYYLSDQGQQQPDAILVLVPGFEGGASNFYILAEQLMRSAQAESSLAIEVWAMDRRSNLLEDLVGLDISEQLEDPQVGLDFLFGADIGLELSQPLIDGPNRRAVLYNNSGDTTFMAQWTPQVHSQDIDAIVEHARELSLIHI
mgnify:FL=1